MGCFGRARLRAPAVTARSMVCRLKEEGGLSVVDIEVQNTCLLLKTMDKLHQGDDNPWVNWVRFRYTPKRATRPTSCWQTSSASCPSTEGSPPLSLAVARRPPSGTTTRPRLAPSPERCRSYSPIASRPTCTCSLALPMRACLCRGWRGACGPRRPAERPTPWRRPGCPSPRLGERGLGAFRRHLLHAEVDGVHGAALQHQLGKLCPIKVRIFFWIFRQGNTRTRDFLHRHDAMGSSTCPFCTATKDAAHLFFNCPRIARLWRAACPHASVTYLAGALQMLPLPLGALLHTGTLLLLWVI